jgi:putative ABC transport system ATP-binding protein
MTLFGRGAPAEQPRLLRDTITRLTLVLRLERRILGIILAYALGIGLFSLIVPLTVQELVNTFAFALQPIMIVTLAGIMAATLVFIGAFKVLQARAVEILIQRLYTRIALAMTERLPRFREETFLPQYVNRFLEAELLPRATLAMLVDWVNVAIGGAIGMTILVMYHPYFLLYNMVLITGFIAIVVSLGRGGLLITVETSEHNYAALNWLQDIAHNLLHFKSTSSTPLLLRKTDEIVQAYVMARKVRSDILTGRQYKGAVIWQAFGHSGLIATAGWLMAIGQLTLGQFVAAEVIVSTLLLNLDTVAKRMYAVIYVFTSLRELSRFFSFPKDPESAQLTVSLPDATVHGIRLTCKEVSFHYPNMPPVFKNLNLEVMPGEKVALFPESGSGKTTLALVLAGLYAPTSGIIRYNDVDLRDLSPTTVNDCRGLILNSHLSLFEGTLEENVSLGRPSVRYEDIQWALHFVDLEEEIDALPLGLNTPVTARGKAFTSSQILRILIARSIATRPQLLVLDGSLRSISPQMRDTLLRRLCSKEEPWSVIIASNDPVLVDYVDRRVILG